MKKIYLSVAIFIAAIILTAKVSAEGIWRLDGEILNELPRNFRTFDDLNISASGQPSMESLVVLSNELKNKLAGDGNIYIVDLREESHGFFNGYPVSWYINKNLANFFKPRYQIASIEAEQLQNMLGRQVDLLPLGNEDKKLFKPVNIFVDSVTTESEAAAALGLIYVRFPVTDMYFPTPEVVDQFINFVANLGENDLVHFHCQAGHGRTTTFTVMYDILKSPEKSLGEICKRHAENGGSDLLTRKVDNGSRDYYVEAHNLRAEELIKFFFYVRGVQREEIGLQWSEYVNLHK